MLLSCFTLFFMISFTLFLLNQIKPKHKIWKGYQKFDILQNLFFKKNQGILEWWRPFLSMLLFQLFHKMSDLRHLYTPWQKKWSIQIGSLLFDWHYLCQFFIKSNKDSFRISFSWGFGNCPWLLNLIKNWWRYWQSKRRLPFTKIRRPLSYVVRCN